MKVVLIEDVLVLLVYVVFSGNSKGSFEVVCEIKKEVYCVDGMKRFKIFFL